jgi:hypothetical protein
MENRAGRTQKGQRVLNPIGTLNLTTGTADYSTNRDPSLSLRPALIPKETVT